MRGRQSFCTSGWRNQLNQPLKGWLGWFIISNWCGKCGCCCGVKWRQWLEDSKRKLWVSPQSQVSGQSLSGGVQRLSLGSCASLVHWTLMVVFPDCTQTSLRETVLNTFVAHYREAMAPHSSTLAWRIPWTEEPGRLQSTGSLRVGHDWATSLSLFTFLHWRRKWQPTPVFLPGESQGQRSLSGYSPRGQKDSDPIEVTEHMVY